MNKLKKIQFIIKNLIFTKLIYIGAFLRIQKISSLGFILFIANSSSKGLLKYLLDSIRNKNKPYLISLKKDGFNQDSFFINQNLKEYENIYIDRTLIKKLSSIFLSKDIDDNSYQSCSVNHEKSKKLYYKFYINLFKMLPKRFKPRAFLSGNYGYYAEQELFRAAADSKINAIALHKECLKTKGRFDLFKYVYSVRRAQFGGNLIIVYNSKESELQKLSGVINETRTKIEIAGASRIDLSHKLRNEEFIPESHKVLIFGFGLQTGLPKIPRKSFGGIEQHNEYLERKHRFLSWKNLIQNFCKSIYESALENPDTDFLIKLKPHYRESYTIINFFKNKSLLKNFKITQKGDSIKLLKESTIVLGFNSTSIFEGLARGSKVIVPHFDECNNEEYKPYIIDFSDTDICLANSPNNLRNLIKDALSEKPTFKKNLSEESKKLLDEWVGNSDGKSSERLTKILKNVLTTNKF